MIRFLLGFFTAIALILFLHSYSRAQEVGQVGEVWGFCKTEEAMRRHMVNIRTFTDIQPVQDQFKQDPECTWGKTTATIHGIGRFSSIFKGNEDFDLKFTTILLDNGQWSFYSIPVYFTKS